MVNVGEEGTLHLEGSILLKDGCGGGAVLAVPPDHERQVRAHGDVDRLWLLAGRFARNLTPRTPVVQAASCPFSDKALLPDNCNGLAAVEPFL